MHRGDVQEGIDAHAERGAEIDFAVDRSAHRHATSARVNSSACVRAMIDAGQRALEAVCRRRKLHGNERDRRYSPRAPYLAPEAEVEEHAAHACAPCLHIRSSSRCSASDCRRSTRSSEASMRVELGAEWRPGQLLDRCRLSGSSQAPRPECGRPAVADGVRRAIEPVVVGSAMAAQALRPATPTSPGGASASSSFCSNCSWSSSCRLVVRSICARSSAMRSS